MHGLHWCHFSPLYGLHDGVGADVGSDVGVTTGLEDGAPLVGGGASVGHLGRPGVHRPRTSQYEAGGGTRSPRPTEGCGQVDDDDEEEHVSPHFLPAHGSLSPPPSPSPSALHSSTPHGNLGQPWASFSFECLYLHPGPGGMHDRLRRPIIHEHGSIGPISGTLVFFFSVGAAVGAALVGGGALVGHVGRPGLHCLFASQ